MKLLKTTFLTFILIGIYTLGFSQSLESNARYIKNNFPNEYENTLKKHALEKWSTDYQMVVYNINQQANSLVKLIKEFESDNTDIAFSGVQKWSKEGYNSSNVEAFRKIKTFDLKSLIGLHCDWQMVKYYYDNQVKAKDAF